MRYLRTLFLLSLFLPTFDKSTSAAPTSEPNQKLQQLLSANKASAEKGIIIIDLGTDEVVFEENSRKAMKPASVLKLLTTYAAFEKLGPEHKFLTRMLVSGRSGTDTDSLYIQGLGDPTFTNESMWILARQVKKLGIKTVRSVIFDDSAFLQDRKRVGQRAYETSPSALPFNFNSVAIEVCPAGAGQKAHVSLDPWDIPVKFSGHVQTTVGPTFAVAVEEKAQQGRGQPFMFALSGKIGESSPCRAVYRSVSNTSEYFAASFMANLRLLGIKAPADYQFAEVPQIAENVFELASRPLVLIVRDLNHFSTNFIGEQILFALGDTRQDTYDRELGIAYLEELLKRQGLSPSEFTLIDGSGLSHENRLSARALGRILQVAYKDDSIGPEFVGSLPVAGRSGTLKKRTVGSDALVLRAKTGTINGVSSLAGYLRSKNGRSLAFAIIQNGVASRDQALSFEDRFVETIYSNY